MVLSGAAASRDPSNTPYGTPYCWTENKFVHTSFCAYWGISLGYIPKNGVAE